MTEDVTAYRTSIEIDAEPEVVFDHFARPELLVRWMGDYARLEPTSGGLFAVDINGVLIRGSFVVVERPRLLEIAWGEAGNEQMPPRPTKRLVRFSGRPGGGPHVDLVPSGLRPGEAK